MNRMILLIALLLLPLAILAQQQVPATEDPARDEGQTADSLLDQIESEAEAIIAAGARTDDEVTEYNRWALSYTKEAYVWHQVSTIIIFFIVIAIVLVGLALAAWQLSAWIGRVKKYDETLIAKLAAGGSVDHELVKGLGESSGGTVDLKSDTLAVSSPYVGVIILGLSMGFFLAYLLLVYPVTPGP